MEDVFKVGVIIKPHGIHGEVKVYPTTDDVKRFKKLKQVILKPQKGDEMTLSVVTAKFFKNLVILKFGEFDTPEELEKFRNAELYVTRENAVPLKEGEFFIADIIGMRALSDDGAYEGVLSDVLTTGANDVYEIELADKRKLYLPAIKDCIKEISPDKGLLTFHMMEGLL